MNAHARHPIRLSSFNGATTFQPWKSPRCCCLSNGRHCFNGATTFQPWKWYEASIGLLSDDASMGPRLFSRGNCQEKGNPKLPDMPLQWGHDFSAVEI